MNVRSHRQEDLAALAIDALQNRQLIGQAPAGRSQDPRGSERDTQSGANCRICQLMQGEDSGRRSIAIG